MQPDEFKHIVRTYITAEKKMDEKNIGKESEKMFEKNVIMNERVNVETAGYTDTEESKYTTCSNRIERNRECVYRYVSAERVHCAVSVELSAGSWRFFLFCSLSCPHPYLLSHQLRVDIRSARDVKCNFLLFYFREGQM